MFGPAEVEAFEVGAQFLVVMRSGECGTGGLGLLVLLSFHVAGAACVLHRFIGIIG